MSDAATGLRELLVEFRVSTRERITGAASALLMVQALSERALVAAIASWDGPSRALSARLQLAPDRSGARAPLRRGGVPHLPGSATCRS